MQTGPTIQTELIPQRLSCLIIHSEEITCAVSWSQMAHRFSLTWVKCITQLGCKNKKKQICQTKRWWVDELMSWYSPFNLAAHRSRGKKGPTQPSLIWRDGSPFFYPGATVSAKIIQIGTSSKTTWKGSIRPQTPISRVFFSWPLYQKKMPTFWECLAIYFH